MVLTAQQIDETMNTMFNEIDKLTAFYKTLNEQLNETQSHIDELTYQRGLYQNVIDECKQSLFTDDLLRDDDKQSLFNKTDSEIATAYIRHIDKALTELNNIKKRITTYMSKTKKQLAINNALQTAIVSKLIEQSLFEE